MWGVLSLVRQGLRRPRRRQRVARVVDGGADEVGAGDVVVAPREPAAAAAAPAGALARALLAMACSAVRLGGEDAGGSAEEAWATSGWRPARAADEVSHLMVREGMRYAIYA